jgi:hypothetical protein
MAGSLHIALVGQSRRVVLGYDDDCVDVGEPEARLIAAAPDLLDACEAALDALLDEWSGDTYQPAIRTLREAIAKAKGEA